MKFARFKKDAISYMQYEQNDEIMSLIGTLLTDDIYKGSKYYLEWLYSVALPSYDISYGGNLVNLEATGEKIDITWKYFSDEEELTPEDLAIRYSAAREELIEIVKKWDEIIIKEPRPENIIVIQDNNNKINIEPTSDDDPRFSRVIEDPRSSPFSKIQKSTIFENYYQVEANTEPYLSLGMLFSDYVRRKKNILEWLNSKEKDRQFYSINYGAFYWENGIICVNIKTHLGLKSYNSCYPMTWKNIYQLLEQWEQILKKEPFPKEVLIYEENGKMVIEEKN